MIMLTLAYPCYFDLLSPGLIEENPKSHSNAVGCKPTVGSVVVEWAVVGILRYKCPEKFLL